MTTKTPTSEKVTLDDKLTEEKTFTTNDKGWKKPAKTLPSKQRVINFCKHLLSKGLKQNISHDTLVYEFAQCFGTNEHRTLERYLGRIKYVQRIVPRNKRKRSFTVTYPPKQGLIEILGYMMRNADNTFSITLQLFDENTEIAKDDVCACNPFILTKPPPTPTPPHTTSEGIHTHISSLEKKRLSPYEQIILEASKKKAVSHG